jgi:hypothetical protein
MDDDPSPEEVGPGLHWTVAALLSDGYGVLGRLMPHMRPGDCTGKNETLFSIPVSGNAIRLFLDPVASLNYLERSSGRDASPHYRAFHMVGLSGGGWTTTVYAAVDTRIQESDSAFPWPAQFRFTCGLGDRSVIASSMNRRFTVWLKSLSPRRRALG